MGIGFLRDERGWFVGRPIGKAENHTLSSRKEPMHDISNKLFLIKSLIEAHRLNIKESVYGSDVVVSDKATETLEKVYLQAERAIQVTNKLKHLSCLDSNATVKRERLSLHVAAERAIELLRKNDTLGDVTIVNSIPKHLPTVNMCSSDLHEILYNIASNAVQALRKSEGQKTRTVTFSAHIYHEPGKKSGLTLHIADSGPGIPIHQLALLFEPFFSTNGKDGNGLGLFIVKKLVQRNGGTISVQSLEGEGTTFQLGFPL